MQWIVLSVAQPAASNLTVADRIRSLSYRVVGWLGCFRFMKDKYSPVLLSGKGKAFVLLGAAALLAAGIWGVNEVIGGRELCRKCFISFSSCVCHCVPKLSQQDPLMGY